MGWSVAVVVALVLAGMLLAWAGRGRACRTMCVYICACERLCFCLKSLCVHHVVDSIKSHAILHQEWRRAERERYEASRLNFQQAAEEGDAAKTKKKKKKKKK